MNEKIFFKIILFLAILSIFLPTYTERATNETSGYKTQSVSLEYPLATQTIRREIDSSMLLTKQNDFAFKLGLPEREILLGEPVKCAIAGTALAILLGIIGLIYAFTHKGSILKQSLYAVSGLIFITPAFVGLLLPNLFAADIPTSFRVVFNLNIGGYMLAIMAILCFVLVYSENEKYNRNKK